MQAYSLNYSNIRLYVALWQVNDCPIEWLTLFDLNSSTRNGGRVPL